MLAAKVARYRAKASNDGKVVCCCSLNHCLGKVAVICNVNKELITLDHFYSNTSVLTLNSATTDSDLERTRKLPLEQSF